MLCTTKVKFGQIVVYCMRNISNLFLAQCWRLETNSRLFYFFIKMTIKQDLTIFNSWHLPFFIVPYSPFQKDDTLESWHNLLLSNWSRTFVWIVPKRIKLARLMKHCIFWTWRHWYFLTSWVYLLSTLDNTSTFMYMKTM